MRVLLKEREGFSSLGCDIDTLYKGVSFVDSFQRSQNKVLQELGSSMALKYNP